MVGCHTLLIIISPPNHNMVTEPYLRLSPILVADRRSISAAFFIRIKHRSYYCPCSHQAIGLSSVHLGLSHLPLTTPSLP